MVLWHDGCSEGALEGKTAEPAIRAAWSARVLTALGQRDAAARDRVLEALGEADSPFRSQPALAWLPMERHVARLEAVVAELGADAAEQMLRQASLANLDSPLVRGPLLATLRVFGIGPLAVLRMFPRGYRVIIRNCGKVEVESSRSSPGTTVRFTELPRVVRREAWVVSVRALFGALLDVGKLTGTVEADTSELAHGRVSIRLLAEHREELVHDVDDV